MNLKVVPFQAGWNARRRSRVRFAGIAATAALTSFGLTYAALRFEQPLMMFMADMSDRVWPVSAAEKPVVSVIASDRTGAYKVEATPSVRQIFARCGNGDRSDCVVDGDTLWLKGRKIRIADIDTPEISSPRCRSEEQRGQRAADRLVQLLNRGAVTIASAGDRDVDRYGRELRVVLVNGRNVGNDLISEGLARPWEGRRRAWC
ncbi:thermonuclease family protein [Rhizobium sp. Root149]|uniref:thermonuclease family protein n=1 Tax=Rhizobium sp. Root149 TaxID=1736473 RepID=UPI000AC06383